MTFSIPQTFKELQEARDHFASLLRGPSTEAAFQELFSRCPYVLSRALPLRLEPTDIQPLARPGKSDPDFIFYPRSSGPLGSFGVIELKRPDTTLITKPRKGVVLLSRDVSTAVAQAQRYSRELRAKLAPRLTSNLILGANDYVFIVAGLSDELVTKLTPGMLHETLESLLPTRCQIIPYDQLFERFESSLHLNIVYLTPLGRSTIRNLESLVELARSGRVERGQITEANLMEIQKAGRTERWQISEANMDFWCTIEDRWRAGGYIGTSISRVIDRPYWCVQGTDDLATESPAHLEFPWYVLRLVECLESSLRLHKILAQAQSASTPIESLRCSLPVSAANVLAEAIERCRATRMRSTWMQPTDGDVQLLGRLGLARMCSVDAGEVYYEIDPLLLDLWQ